VLLTVRCREVCRSHESDAATPAASANYFDRTRDPAVLSKMRPLVTGGTTVVSRTAPYPVGYPARRSPKPQRLGEGATLRPLTRCPLTRRRVPHPATPDSWSGPRPAGHHAAPGACATCPSRGQPARSSRLLRPHAQQHGLGKQLVRHALTRIIGVSENIGVRAVVVHALTERLVAFYSGLGFEFWIDPFTGFLRVGDIRESMPDHGFLG
jgi:GNAT superfamily N-acetyltransferase